MELLTENRITVTKSLFLEGFLRISRDGYGKAVRKVMLVFLAVWAAFLVFTLAVQGDILQSAAFLGLIGLIGLWLCVVMPRSNAKKAWKAQETRFGSNMPRVTRFFEDRLTISGDGVEKTVAYEDVREIKYSKNLMILVCEDNIGVMLALDGFQNGSAVQVESQIKKCKENTV